MRSVSADFDSTSGGASCSGTNPPCGSAARALDVLHALAGAKGDVVSKTELLARVWPGVAVGENNLQVQISLLRKTLQEDASGESYLVTVPGRGYRLLGLDMPAQGPALPDKP